MRPQCSWVMLIGISAHCAILTQDIPGPAFPVSTRALSNSDICFLRTLSTLKRRRENKAEEECGLGWNECQSTFLFHKGKRNCERLVHCISIPVRWLERVMMHFWTFTPNKARFPPSNEVELEIHKFSWINSSLAAKHQLDFHWQDAFVSRV